MAVGLYLGRNQLSGEMTYGVLGRVKMGSQIREEDQATLGDSQEPLAMGGT